MKQLCCFLLFVSTLYCCHAQHAPSRRPVQRPDASQALSYSDYDGQELWLPQPTPAATAAVRITANAQSPTISLARREMERGWRSSPDVAFVLQRRTSFAGGYAIALIGGAPSDGAIQLAKVTSDTEIGLLYGAFDLLRRQNTGQLQALGTTQHAAAATPPRAASATPQRPANISQRAAGTTSLLHEQIAPAWSLRMLNHWDNLDGSIERGYAGKSIFWNADLPHHMARLETYARANASIGINAVVLNNVNAAPKILTDTYLDSVRIVADALRPWGIRVFLSVNFGTPKSLGELPTADPLDAAVRRWWARKAKAIYRLIPDFGGFLVKANSEGQPGPFDYGRTHADGANMLADALQPFGGRVVWRSFVYGAAHKGEDRVKQAVSEFAGLDGRFRPNVILQSKNGPLDFQPREPYAPIFDAMKQTPQGAELQITQEYLGQSRHLTYLAPMWQEFFSYVRPDRLELLAGVANVGDDANLCGHDFSQANWYAFGRLAWNPALSSEQIATEWLQQTFGTDSAFVQPLREVMMASREACVDYMMPLGLHHIFKFDHHYGPEPDGFKAEYPLEWCPVYYHQADSAGIGFDRSSRGTGATQQYAEPYRSLYDRLETCPENLLLWFHHVPWTHRMKDGRTLWENLVSHYDHGVAQVMRFRAAWREAKAYVDQVDAARAGRVPTVVPTSRRWQRVDRLLQHQEENAREWRDTCLGYFGRFAQAGEQAAH
jgi:alpha-glucuronidase